MSRTSPGSKDLAHRKPHLAGVWNIHNWDEDMTRPLTELAPKRWKVFQVLTTPEVCVCAICLDNYVDPKSESSPSASKTLTGVCVVHVKVPTKLAAQHHHDQIREASASAKTCSLVRRTTNCPTCNQEYPPEKDQMSNVQSSNYWQTPGESTDFITTESPLM